MLNDKAGGRTGRTGGTGGIELVSQLQVNGIRHELAAETRSRISGDEDNSRRQIRAPFEIYMIDRFKMFQTAFILGITY